MRRRLSCGRTKTLFRERTPVFVIPLAGEEVSRVNRNIRHDSEESPLTGEVPRLLLDINVFHLRADETVTQNPWDSVSA
jgi:hypothetical protein